MGENPTTALWALQRERVQYTIACLVDRERKRISRGVYLEADALDLNAATAAADEAFSRLSVCLDVLAEERPNLAVEAWANVWGLFDAAFNIGGRSTISESGNKRVAVHKTAKMREAKQATVRKENGSARIGTADKQRALEKAILHCVDDDVSRLSSYIDNINPPQKDVRAAMETLIDWFDASKPWPKTSTVRTAILSIKKMMATAKS
jgi:hypothetical protein